ncbi:plasmid pRiA4b ORF-3 family protein [Enterobacter chuandaensis]|uniref:Plasmid pRiA4b ORF-3 family protein n=1 Tax=Enterobacter chuandaensis TaxID=2497875 RepID=A0AA96M6M2_9ENTR|nr:plasmid pRiA4b ORF-3 family protein [Enterobacter chuandaensis]MCW4781002.1 plasmid pRiA4b ORF-3 family protein [Enterobacter chuandaensis]MDA4758854.1 plasmid pRiA4b ORF-3 family protein [Enterobacter chuandaensis]WNS39910.1 plasmid pRiA4b ORF-3 family protein [Enterobacter chuandaensis]
MSKFYLLKITLNGVTPSIWRTFTVPADISLDRLHDVIQIVMGWDDSHLHQFTFKKRVFTEFPSSIEDEDESEVRLSELLTKRKNTLTYTYDFGDDWEHTLFLEDSDFKPAGPDMLFECFAGENTCPPEDCGGSYQYQRMIDAMKNPAKNPQDFEEYSEVLDIADNVTPDDFKEFIRFFDPDAVTSALMLYARWSRERPLPLFNDDLLY